MFRYLGMLILFASLVLTRSVNAQDASTQPVPDEAARTEAMRITQELFKDDLAKAKSSEDKVALAMRFLAMAKESRNDPAGAYVLIERAKNLSLDAVDASAFQEAARLQGQFFAVDELGVLLAGLQKLAKATTPAQSSTLYTRVEEMIDRAVSADRYEVAMPLSDVAVLLAQKIGDQQIRRKSATTARELKEMEKAYGLSRKALDQLTKSPQAIGDPANLDVGRYLCFYKGDWSAGLKYLAKATDPLVRAAAEGDVRSPTGGEDKKGIADLWLKVAENESDIAKRNLQERALKLYREALPLLAGLKKAQVENTLRRFAPEDTAAKPTAKANIEVRVPPKPADPAQRFLGDWTLYWENKSAPRRIKPDGKVDTSEINGATWEIKNNSLIMHGHTGYIDTFDRWDGDVLVGTNNRGAKLRLVRNNDRRPTPTAEDSRDSGEDAITGSIQVSDPAGNPVQDAVVYFVHPDKKICTSGKTDFNGKVHLKWAYTGGVVVFCAHKDFCAFRMNGHNPAKELDITLRAQQNTGSIVCGPGAGTEKVPGLSGRINPIHDHLDRLYMYAQNISINDGKTQPVTFRLGVPLKVEDQDGNCFALTVVDIIGSTSLIEFKKR